MELDKTFIPDRKNPVWVKVRDIEVMEYEEEPQILLQIGDNYCLCVFSEHNERYLNNEGFSAGHWNYWQEIEQPEPDLTVCPRCKGEPDNGFDRCVPPSPYICTKCEEEITWKRVKEPDKLDLMEMLEKSSGLVEGHIEGKQAVWLAKTNLKELLEAIIKRIEANK